MGYRIENGDTPVIVFRMVDASDDETSETGLSPTVYLSKNGGTGAATTNSASQVDATNMPGLYKVTLTATETNTDGSLTVRATAAGANEFWDIYQVETLADVALTAAGVTAVAEEVMKIDLSDYEADTEVQTSGNRNLARMIAKDQNKTAFVGSRLDVYETDDTTVLYSQTGTSGTAVDLTGLAGAA